MIKKILAAVLILFVLGFGKLLWDLSGRILTVESSIDKTKSRIAKNWKKSFDEYLAYYPIQQDLALSGYENIKINAKHFAKSDTMSCAIIMAHGWTSTWAGMLKYLPVFKDCDCDIFLYDQRAHGRSEGTYPSAGILEAKDLVSITQSIHDNYNIKFDNIGWFGASWGASTVLNAGAYDTDVGFIIADAPFKDWISAVNERAVREYGDNIKLLTPLVMGLSGFRAGIDYKDASAEKAVKATKEPVLILHSASDSETGAWHSQEIAKGLNDKSCFRMMRWGAEHTSDIIHNEVKMKSVIDSFLLVHKPSVLCENVPEDEILGE